MSRLDLIHWRQDFTPTDYREVWREQVRLHARRADEEVPDSCLLGQHSAVFTAGRRSDERDLPTDGSEVVRVDRGGEVTWHGPGQVVGYPIVKLPVPIGLVAHVRRIEEAIIRTCGDFGVPTGRIVGRSGVWVLGEDAPQPLRRPTSAQEQGLDRKIAAIGIRVARYTTMHGFALNCDADLSAFDKIGPCGIRDAGVTSLTLETGRPVGVSDVLPRLEHHLRKCLLHDADGGMEDVVLAPLQADRHPLGVRRVPEGGG